MDKTKIIDYIMFTPINSNWNVLSTMIGEGDWSKLRTYVETTPYNMNRKVLESFFDIGVEENALTDENRNLLTDENEAVIKI